MTRVWTTALCVLMVSGCTVKKEMVPIGGSRADGTVRMGYSYGIFEDPVTDMVQATERAGSKCRLWGYRDAEAFGGQTRQCSIKNAEGNCIRYDVMAEFQCSGKENADQP